MFCYSVIEKALRVFIPTCRRRLSHEDYNYGQEYEEHGKRTGQAVSAQDVAEEAQGGGSSRWS